ncbi:DASS family sodium-coupled anion symporter [Aquifex aeolicus]|uniref:Transporter (Pho87 family) n=1 Tax=Aquifex aeolicus (strain VF5) TaxID=224324 RepID=O66449_AQUAE|nr:DASS family sodium-coupled anion symporter [Aquifex aeolicus]AAC06409.1 transporter (Pho87 family) [Aquifex aeolicus VF5]
MNKNVFLVLAILVFFGVLITSPFEGNVNKGIAILLLAAILWITEALPLPVTALLIPVSGVLLGVFDVKTALSYFAHPLIFLFFGGFVLAVALSKYQIDEYIAHKIVSVAQGKFLPSVFLLMLATSLISMWISNTSTTAMMLPLALGILAGVRETEREKVFPFVLLGIAYSASVGGIGTLVGSPPNGIAAGILGLSFPDWLKFGIPVFLILFPLLFAILFLVFRPTSDLKVERVQEIKFEFTPQRVLVLLIFLFTALAWIFSKKIAPIFEVKKYFDTVVALLAVVALFIFRLLDWRDVKEGVSWGTLLLFGGGIALSGIMKKTGTAKFISQELVDVLHGLPTFLFLLTIVLFVIFLTELMSNTATTALIAPILFSTAQMIGKPPEMLVIPAAVAASCAFMLPVATPPNAIVYGTGYIKQSQMMRVGLILNIVFSIVLAAFFTVYVGG